MLYAPPSHPPSATSSRPFNRYSPTTVPTPGQPLLRNGKMLIYPNNWQGCSECHDIGYRHGDPLMPCRRCWGSYAQKPNHMLISSAGMPGAKVLQKPLPVHQGYNTTNPQGDGWHHSQNTGGSYQTAHMTGQYATPPSVPQRRGPPQVTRAEDANETLEDENGEAPPAYDDAVAAGPNGVLPPQRRNSNGHLEAIPTSNSNENAVAPQQTDPSGEHSNAYPPTHTNTHSLAAPPQHQQHQYHYPIASSTHPYPQGWYTQQQTPTAPFFQPQPAQMVTYAQRPPPGALVLHPGDPRIGGQLCFKCGGAGVRESMWWGDETCSRCSGSGRVF